MRPHGAEVEHVISQRTCRVCWVYVCFFRSFKAVEVEDRTRVTCGQEQERDLGREADKQTQAEITATLYSDRVKRTLVFYFVVPRCTAEGRWPLNQLYPIMHCSHVDS